jgi:SSS family solute:Na+ symporter/sodium/pantothenate symporter
VSVIASWFLSSPSLLAASDSTSTPSVGYGALVMLVLFILASMWIGARANKVTREGSFMKGFFLGNRGLGAWALALTATVQSGGTFMGFPSLVYTHGWIVALWIGGYMVVPITGFSILGKRLAQLSRRTGAITVPDLFRTRFGSPSLGLVASLFILLYMSFMMFAQFKAGGILMKLAWPDAGVFAFAEDAVIADVDVVKYHTGLVIFSLIVVGYTMLGGFLAAVWTDLFQSVLMFIGVMILLFASLSQVGSLENATLTSLKHTGPGYVFGPGYDDKTVLARAAHGVRRSSSARVLAADIGVVLLLRVGLGRRRFAREPCSSDGQPKHRGHSPLDLFAVRLQHGDLLAADLHLYLRPSVDPQPAERH